MMIRMPPCMETLLQEFLEWATAQGLRYYNNALICTVLSNSPVKYVWRPLTSD